MFRVLILLSAAALAGAAGRFSDGMKAFENVKDGSGWIMADKEKNNDGGTD